MKPSRIQFPRLAAEALAIVISILLAFAIDAWWENRRHKQEAVSATVGLRADFVQARIDLDALLEGNLAIAATADTVVQLLSGPQNPARVPLRHLIRLLQTPTYDPPTGELDALLQSGTLDFIEDKKLRQVLTAWPSAVDDLDEKSQLHVDFVYEQFLPALRRSFPIRPLVDYRFDPPPPDSVISVPVSPELIGLVEHLRVLVIRTLRSGGGIGPVANLLEEIERLLNEP